MIHVVPIDDSRPHFADGTCCNPHVADIVTHHSFDRREVFERQGRVGKGWEVMVEDQGELRPQTTPYEWL